MKRTNLLLLTTLLLASFSYGQEKPTVDAKLGFILNLSAHNDLSQKFGFGVGATLGAAIFMPNMKSYIIPQVGFDFMPRGVGSDDTYRETMFFTNIGVEFMYTLVEVDHYKFLPFIGIDSRKVIDRYLIANGDIIVNSNGSSELDYDKQPPIFSTSALAFTIGAENRIKNWYIRLAYQIYNPQVTADLNHSYDAIDNSIFSNGTGKLNLSVISIGIGTYL